MDQTVLMNADIHKSAEVDDVADGAFQLHARFQILHPHHVGAQQRRGQFVPGIPAGLGQLRRDILQGGQADPQLLRQGFLSPLLHPFGQIRHPAPAHVLRGIAADFQQRSGGGVAFRMHGGGVQHILAFRHPQKAGALFKGFGPQLGHLFQRCPGDKGPVLLPEGHDIFRHRAVDSRHPGEQRRGGGVQVHPHRVDAGFHHSVQRLAEMGLGHIVLVLPHADGFGVDLHQLRQRVLEPPGDGHGGTQGNIVFRELLRRQLGGGIDRSPRLAHHHIGQAGVQFLNEIGGEYLRLMGSGAVADGEHLHPMGRHPLFHLGLGLGQLGVGRRGIDHPGIQHLAGAVHHRTLAAGAVAGIQAQGHLPLHRGLHQQLPQVDGEHPDGGVAGRFGELIAQLPLDGGEDQPVVSVRRRFPHRRGAGAALLHMGGFHNPQRLVPVEPDGNLEEFLPFPPVDGQNPVPGDFIERFMEIIIKGVNAVLLLGGLGDQFSPGHAHHPQALAHPGVVGDHLRQNILGSLQGVLRRRHLLGDVGRGQFQGIGPAPFLGVEGVGQRLQALGLRHRGPGFPLGPVRPVEVLDFGEGDGGVQSGGQFFRQRPLLLDGSPHLFPLLIQIAQIQQPLVKLPEHLVVQGAGHLLAVTGDKGNGVAVVDQLDGILHLLGTQMEFRGQGGVDIHKNFSILSVSYPDRGQTPAFTFMYTFSTAAWVLASGMRLSSTIWAACSRGIRSSSRNSSSSGEASPKVRPVAIYMWMISPQ